MSTKKAPVSSAQLIKQKQEAEARLNSLRQDQVDALEEGRDFPHSNEFVTLNERIAALDKAIARAEEREEKEYQRAAAADQADTLQAQLDKIKAGERLYLDSVKRVGEVMPQIVEALQQIGGLASPMYSAIRAATKEDHVPTFDNTNIEMRLAAQIGRYLAQVSHRGSYGRMHWPFEGDVVGDMVATEAAEISGSVRHAEKIINAQIDQLRRIADGALDAE